MNRSKSLSQDYKEQKIKFKRKKIYINERIEKLMTRKIRVNCDIE
jgi:hypothetical protein